MGGAWVSSLIRSRRGRQTAWSWGPMSSRMLDAKRECAEALIDLVVKQAVVRGREGRKQVVDGERLCPRVTTQLHGGRRWLAGGSVVQRRAASGRSARRGLWMHAGIQGKAANAGEGSEARIRYRAEGLVEAG